MNCWLSQSYIWLTVVRFSIPSVPLAPAVAAIASKMVYGTLPFARRDFILEYLEWTVHQRRGLEARPWVFGFGFHPYEIEAGEFALHC